MPTLTLTPNTPGNLLLTAPYPLSVLRVFSVLDYGAKGDGTTDDTTAINNAKADAVANLGVLYFPANHTWLISSTITIGGQCIVEGNFTTIKKAASHTGNAIAVTGSNVVIHRLKLDGNRSGGATGQGISWQAAGGVLEDSTVTSCKSHGIIVETNAAAVLTCRRCTSTDNYTSNGNGTAGFACSAGTLYVEDCDATLNDSYGFQFTSGAADGCRLDGRSSRNGIAGARIGSNKGTCKTFVSRDEGLYVTSNQIYGLYVSNDLTTAGASGSDWTFGHVAVHDPGKTVGSTQSVGIELVGAYRCKFGSVVVMRSSSYGIALTRNSSNPSIGSYYNSFGSVLIDREGAVATNDVGIVLTGDSSWNHFATSHIRYANMGVKIGEDVMPLPAPSDPINVNIHNTFGVLHIERAAYGALIINFGRYNHVGRLVSRNNYNSDTAIAQGVVNFYVTSTATIPSPSRDSSWVVGNVVDFVDHKTESGTKPTYVCYADTLANGNIVRDVLHRGDYVTAIDQDDTVIGNNRLNDWKSLTYSASITPDVSMGHRVFSIVASNTTAFTINAPTGLIRKGQQITFRIHNNSGGVMGAITWTGFALAGNFTNPANTHIRMITFEYDNNSGSWLEISRTANDI